MGLDVTRVSMEYLARPSGAAYDFAYALVDDCEVTGDGHAFGWFLREQLEERARQYVRSRSIDRAGQQSIDDWIGSLPYDSTDYIVLGFDW